MASCNQSTTSRFGVQNCRPAVFVFYKQIRFNRSHLYHNVLKLKLLYGFRMAVRSGFAVRGLDSFAWGNFNLCFSSSEKEYVLRLFQCSSEHFVHA